MIYVPDFDEFRIRSSNGKQLIWHIVDGRSFFVRAGRSRTRAWADFDMNCSNHNIKPDMSDGFAKSYARYCKQKSLRPTIYTTFTHKVWTFQVWKDDIQEWFSDAFQRLSNIVHLERIRVPDWFGSGGNYHLPADLLVIIDRVPDGEIIGINHAAFTQFVEALTFDYTILSSIHPREFEKAVAAVYARTGRFDRVILTPRSADKGRDIILESESWGDRRVLVELKQYKNRSVSAEQVNALIGVLSGEKRGSTSALLTTASFAPRIREHPSIENALTSKQIELLNFTSIIEGCIQSEYSDAPLHFSTCSVDQ